MRRRAQGSLLLALLAACGPLDTGLKTATSALGPKTDFLYARSQDGSVQLLWSPTPGASQYRVQRSLSSDFSGAVDELIVTRRRHRDLTVSNGTTYRYRVIPIDESGADGTPSTVATAHPEPVGVPGDGVDWFGSAGAVSGTVVGGSWDGHATRAVELPDGRLLIAGDATDGVNSMIIVQRLLEDGSDDPTFTTLQIVPFSASDITLTDMRVAADGSFVLAGTIFSAGITEGVIGRYWADGTPISTFGFNGLIADHFGGKDMAFEAAVVLADGSVIAAGYVSNGTNHDVALLHYLPTGGRDPAFNSNSNIFTHDFGVGDDVFLDLLIDSGNRIVVAGRALNTVPKFEALLGRFSIDGTLDLSFGGGGSGYFRRQYYAEGTYYRVREQAGALQATGYSSGDGSAGEGAGASQGVLNARHHLDGTLDLSWNGGLGFSRSDVVAGGVDQGHGLIAFSDGESFVSGWAINPVSGFDTVLLKYRADGTLDPAFAGTGVIEQNRSVGATASDHDEFQDAIQLKDGTAVAVGNLQGSPQRLGLIFRHWLTGGLPGAACAQASDCGSGFCVDGVCCNTACGNGATDDCQACSIAAGAGGDGTCAPVDAGEVCRASANSCDAPEACDGIVLTCPADAPPLTVCNVPPPPPLDPQLPCSGGICGSPRDYRVGCGCGSGGDPSGLALVALALVVLGPRRRARRP